MSNKHKTAKPVNKSPNPLIWIIPLVVLALAAGAYFLWPRDDQQSAAAAKLPPEISVDEAHAKYQSGTFLLDVRTPEEWQEVHIPNTTLIPLDQLPSRLSELPRDQEIVVVCRSGNRSQQGRDILLNAGFASVTSMAGGVKQWSASGYPTTSGP
jgi:rhodanese-related sulfurtransferase